MGATNDIKETNISLKLRELDCSQCSQKFTEEDIQEKNFDFFFDTTNEVSLIPMEQLAKLENIEGYDWLKRLLIEGLTTEYFKSLYFPFGQTGYQFSIWIRSIEHQDCPDTETCQRCWDKFLLEQTEQYQGEYYCLSCYQLIEKDYE